MKTKDIEQEAIFTASPGQVSEAWLDSKEHSSGG